jgi:hypothetical protein
MRIWIQGFDDRNIYNFKFFHQKLPNIHPKASMKDDQTTGAASDSQTRTSTNKKTNKISVDPCGSGSITLAASITIIRYLNTKIFPGFPFFLSDKPVRQVEASYQLEDYWIRKEPYL